MLQNQSLLMGYYGMKNSGDDALLLASHYGLSHFLDAERISVQAYDKISLNSHTLLPKNQSDVQKFPGQNRLALYRMAAMSRSIVLGGGSVLHSERDIRLLMQLMRLSGRGAHRALGVGVGPFRDSASEMACAEWLKRCHFVAVRDYESYQLAKYLAPDANIKLSFDLAPSLLCLHSVEDSIAALPRRGIGVSLCPVFEKDQLHSNIRLVHELSQALIKLSKHYDQPIYLIDFNGHTHWGDKNIHDQLQASISTHAPVVRVHYDPNPIRLLTRIASLRLMIGMRLHASIFGYMARTPVFNLSYHSKCHAWARQIQSPDEYVFDFKKIDALKIQGLASKGFESSFLTPSMPVDHAVRSSLSNFSAFQFDKELYHGNSISTYFRRRSTV